MRTQTSQPILAGELQQLYADLIRYNATLAFDEFTRQWFDLSTSFLERRVVDEPGAPYVRETAAVFEVLSYPRFADARLQLHRSPRRNDILRSLAKSVSESCSSSLVACVTVGLTLGRVAWSALRRAGRTEQLCPRAGPQRGGGVCQEHAGRAQGIGHRA